MINVHVPMISGFNVGAHFRKAITSGESILHTVMITIIFIRN